jgi:hypothetical protein
MDVEDLSRSSSSGRGPNSNVSRSGSRSSRSSSCLGAYGWSNLIDETIYGQLNSTRSGRKHATNSLSSCRGANRVDSNASEPAKSADCFQSWPLEKTSSTEASPSMAVEVWRCKSWWGMTPKFPAAAQPYVDPCACRQSFLQRVATSFPTRFHSTVPRHPCLQCLHARKRKPVQLRPRLEIPSRRRLKLLERPIPKMICRTIPGPTSRKRSFSKA